MAANLNPDWPGMVAMLAAGGALNHLGIRHFRASGDIQKEEVLEKYLRFARCAKTVTRLKRSEIRTDRGAVVWGMYSATVSHAGLQKQIWD